MAAPGWPYRPWEWVRIVGGTAILQTLSVATAAGGMAWAHKRADFPALTGTGKNIGSAIVFRVFRDPADGDDTYPDDAGLIQVGIHFEQDTMGSRSITTK